MKKSVSHSEDRIGWLTLEDAGVVVRLKYEFCEVSLRWALAYFVRVARRYDTAWMEIEYRGRLWSVRWD